MRERGNFLNGQAEPVVDGAYGRFNRAIETNYAQPNRDMGVAMSKIEGLAVEFRNAMIANRMPVDVAIETEYEESSDRNRYEDRQIIRRVRFPMWLAVSGTNLSGEPMRQAVIEKETCSYSLGSGTPNNFRKEFKETDPEKLDKLELRGGTKLRYDERAIAVSTLGELAVVSRYYRGASTWEVLYDVIPFDVSSRPAEAKDLFNIQGNINPKRIAKTMEGRLDKSVEHYSRKLKEEQSDKDRPPRIADYYSPRDIQIPPAKPERKKGLRRLFS